MRSCLAAIAVITIVLSGQSAHAQWPGWQVRQDYRNVRQDWNMVNADRNRLMYDRVFNPGNVNNDINRLRGDQRLLNTDRQQLWYDRSQYNPGYYYPSYYQQPQVQYQQPQVPYYQQPQVQYEPPQPQYTVQRYQIPAEYAGTAPGYVISYGGVNYLTGNDGTMTVYNGPVSQ